ncbi:PLC-like phosphodiesterase [Achaetomium macrosporum]|uniref:Phosphoinositide phospholipase C n=1 Tax=Achaetomium macrosporum TaxID=79813 RepID=A0AAN7CBK1_9PEZI|nr:PLC-like phosphodiesterase [Achaetomium macrosporum]
MASDPPQAWRARPSQVKTNLDVQTQLVVIPPSAISNSSVSPASNQHPSPAQSVLTLESGLSTASSLQKSPETLVSLPDKGFEDIEALVTPFQLPDPVSAKQQIDQAAFQLSRRTSTSSLSQTTLRGTGTTATGEAVRMSLARRASNSVRKAGGVFKRRPSSTNPSRDGSVGPGLMRRRGSMSNQVAPFETASTFYSDSDDEGAVSAEDRLGSDGSLQELGSLGSTTPYDGFGLIPLALRQGVTLTKVTKKNSTKRITVSLDPDFTKIWWDRNRSSSKCIYIDDIKEIRTAEDIRQYRLDAALPETVEPRFFSLIYTPPGKTGTKTLHLIADTDESFQQWVQALDIISKHRQDFATSLMSFNDKAVRAYWGMEMDKQLGKLRAPEDEHIDFAGVVRVCRSLHIHVSTEQLRWAFDMAKGRRASSDDLPSGQSHTSRLNFDEFLEFVRLMSTRMDIRRVYQAHTNNTEVGMTKAEFLQFLRQVQGEDVDADLASWEAVFARFARKGRAKDAEKQATTGEEGITMSEAAFAGFLTSTSNDVIPKEPQNYVLDRPMNEYYISSSHNTYLLGRQVASVSSTEGYITALLRGCRCVEIDCWEGQDNQPIVKHGHSWTTCISFLEVVKTINKYAFAKSHFPLWISLEVRCPPAVQINMAKIMIEVFGDKLVRAPLDPSSDRLPSPSELMDRILIKVKKPDESIRTVERTGRRRGNSMPSPYQRALTMENMPVPAPSSPLLSPTPASRSNRQINTITEGMVHEPVSSSPSECDSEGEGASAKRATSKIHPVLGELGVYCMGIHFEGFDSPDAKKFNHIFSFKEKTFAEKSQQVAGKRALYRHNMRYMMRVYPNGGRISSSNFDPLLYWKRGVQMAALNWQTFDTGMQLNQAMFDGGTAQSGYVLKPLEGRQIQVMPNLSPDECVGKRPRKRVAFEIEVISAQQLMRPYNLGEKRTLDPYIEVEVLMADDKRNKADAAIYAAAQQMQLKKRTKIVRDNGFNPEFNERCLFDVITKYPDLIFVRWSVKLADKGDKGYNDKPPLATFTAKLSNLKQGYRTIPLLNHNGERFLFSTLFCKIRIGPFTDIMVSYQEDSPTNGNKLKNIGRNVFSQTNTSPKSSMDSSRT